MARSGVCPTVPQKDSITYDDTPPVRDTKSVAIPDAAFASCAGGVNVEEVVGPRPDGITTTITTCCPSPGPAGPQGEQGEGVPAGGTTGQKLEKIDNTDYNTQWVDVNEVPAGGTEGQVLAKLSDTDYDLTWSDSGIGNITWRGYWTESVTYYDNDIVSHNNSSYVCNIEHVSSADNAPDKNFDADPGGFEWSLLSAGSTEEEGSLIDQVLDGYLDWLGPIKDWGLAEVGSILAIGGGLYWGYTELADMLAGDGTGDGEANSNYTGDAIYNPAGSPLYDPPTLDEVISKICDHANITSYDVSALQGSPQIYVNLTIGTITSARTMLDLLSKIYFFDMVDSAGTLKFLPRGDQISVRTLTEREDLGWNNSETGTAPIIVKRYQGIDLPKSIQIEYFSEAQGYNKMTQEAILETFSAGQDTKINVPFTLTEDEAYAIAEKLLVNSHSERTQYAFTTSYAHIDLEPGDIITVENISDVRILRIDETNEGLLNFQTVDASFNAETYELSGMASEVPPTYDDTPVVIGYSAGIAVELPPLDATDINPRFTIGVHGYGKAGWPGAAVYMSSNGGTSYTNIGSVSQEATFGLANSFAAPTEHRVWDNDTTITVTLKTGTLSSVSRQEVQNGKNWAIIGNEIVGFTTATLISGTTYELTELLRGRRGTEIYMDEHTGSPEGELFMLLNDALFEFEYPVDAKDLVYMFKYVTNGSDVSKATAYSVQGNMKSRRPWTVSDFEATQTGSPNTDWTMTWTGRNQFNGEMIDGGQVDNPDGFRGYSIAILDQSGSPEVIKRSTVTQLTNYTYSTADQISDWGSAQSSITVRINQLDNIAGVGYPTVETFS